MRLYGLWIYLLLSFGVSAEALVPRRVLLVNFVNQNKVTQAEYLSVTVPESFIGPLQKTAAFEVLSRDQAIDAAKKLNIADAALFTDANAVALGQMGYAFSIGPSFNFGINGAVILGSSEKDSAKRFLLFVTAEWF